MKETVSCQRPLRAASLGFDGYFSLEPHLASAGTFSGFSGPELFRKAAGAFKSYSADRASNGPDGKQSVRLLALNGLDVSPNSVVRVDGAEVGLTTSGQWVAVLAPSGISGPLRLRRGDQRRRRATLVLGPKNTANLDVCALLPWLRPRPLGTRTSAGFGDRLGPPPWPRQGHARGRRRARSHLRPAVHKRDGAYGQEPPGGSRRRNLGRLRRRLAAASGLTPTISRRAGDIDACVAAGYTFFTFDPGEYVDDGADNVGAIALRRAFDDCRGRISKTYRPT